MRSQPKAIFKPTKDLRESLQNEFHLYLHWSVSCVFAKDAPVRKAGKEKINFREEHQGEWYKIAASTCYR